MATNPPTRFWTPSPNRLLALAALILFILAAIAFVGDLSGANGHLLLATGLACLAAEGVL